MGRKLLFPELKEELQAKGVWREFVVYRDGLKENGIAPSKARDMALKRFLGDEAVARARSDGRLRSIPQEPAAPAESPDVKPDKASSAPPPAKPRVAVASNRSEEFRASELPAPPGYAGKEKIAGKEASELDCIRWVMRNLYIRDVTIDDAPDGVAWTMLNIIRSTPGAPMEFLKGAYAKTIPNRSQIEMENPAGEDGKKIEEMCGELRELKERLEGEKD